MTYKAVLQGYDVSAGRGTVPLHFRTEEAVTLAELFRKAQQLVDEAPATPRTLNQAITHVAVYFPDHTEATQEANGKRIHQHGNEYAFTTHEFKS